MATSAHAHASTPIRYATDLLGEARERERAGCFPEAIESYEAAIAAAESAGEPEILAEALRRLAVVRQHGGETDVARQLCERSYAVARRIADGLLAAEALNTLACVDLLTGSPDSARRRFLQSLALGGASRDLRARVEQNLGILANIQGELDEARSRYERSLDAYRAAGDEHGCAIAYHNLGMVSADQGLFDDADHHFQASRRRAERLGDPYLRGLCLVNQGEVDVARQRFENARQSAEEAIAIFDQITARGPQADAHRVMGMIFRETGRTDLAEDRLRTSIDMAAAAGSVLSEAEATRELAVLYQTMGQNCEALQRLNEAHRLFRRLDARVELVDVGGKVAELEGTYLAVVRAWGRSIEASDGRTFGHSERVAQNAVAVARVLGLDEHEETTILLGAYLHDLGKVRIPAEILHKAGPLTRAERAVLERHPVLGVEMLAGIEFPWDLKAIIRWHHERRDGTGYPDRLRGDDIPLAAQIVGIVEAHDALATAHPELSAQEVTDLILAKRAWWSDQVVDAFLAVVSVAPPASSI